MTRKLTIRTKLAGTLAVPLAALAGFAALQVEGAHNLADHVRRQADVATSATGPTGLLSALENERGYESLWEIGAQDSVDPTLQTSGDAATRTSIALSSFRATLTGLGGEAANNYRAVLVSVSNRLATLRKSAQEHAATVGSIGSARQAAAIFDQYTVLINQLLDVDLQAAQTINDATLHQGAELLNAIARQHDAEEQMAVDAVLASVSHDQRAVAEVQGLSGVQQAGETRLRTIATDAYASAILGTLTGKNRADIASKLERIANDPTHVKADDVFRTVQASTSLWRVPLTNTANVVAERAQALTSNAQDKQRDWVIVAILSILLAIAMQWLASKWITKPLRKLAEQAGSMAGNGLPNAVHAILATPAGEDVQKPEIAPVHVRAGGEVREVAEALNRVQDSALDLAMQQAKLRSNVADAFVNLGRRNQNLLSRQLEFISQLERSESDPETLEHLFKLDHLATRMRRNAESLLVMAGHAPPRTWSAPVEVSDVVRGALGEVEGYQRVRLKHLDDARVDGTAAVDVSHVVAELVENALSFSPPDSSVEIYGRRDEFGYVLTIVDQGIGMAAEDLEHANALISSADVSTFAPSKFLGHYVVAQLAHRHGLLVHLSASPAGGLTAMIALPGVLIGAEPPAIDANVADDDVAAPGAERPLPALPRRDVARDAAPAPAPVAPPAVERPLDAPRLPVVFMDRSAQAAPAPAPTPAPAPVADVAPPPLALVPTPAPDPAPQREPVAHVEPEPAPEAASKAEPEAEPQPQRPRVGLGTFADLRATPAPRVAPQPQPQAHTQPQPESEPAAEAAPVAPIAEQPPAPDRAAAFSEIAHAVETIGTPVAPSTFSEDLLPNKLPKRGRRASKMSAQWTRQQPATPIIAPPAPQPAPAPVPEPIAEAEQTQQTVPPATADGAHQEPEPAPSGAADGDERFAFFAAFRAAAERAREEAGIDDRRVGR